MFQSNLTRITGTLHEDQYTFSTISHLIILRTKIFFSRKKIVEEIKTHILCLIIFYFSKMRFACWMTKATNTHLEYVILPAFPLQQWLYERAAILRYTYINCLIANFLLQF